MKNIIKLLSVFLLVFTFSCEDSDDGRFKESPETGWVQFTSTEASFFNEDLVANETSSIEIPVELRVPINASNLTVTYDVVEVSGTGSSIVSTGNSVTFGANTNQLLDPLTLNIDLTTLENNIFTDYAYDVVLTGTSSSLVKVGIAGDDNFPTTFRVNFSAPCMPPTVGGMYSVYTEYGYHDFLPDYANNTMEMEVVDLGSQNYFVQDFSGGLYSAGPYVAAYGTGATSMDVTFQTVCNNITWTNQNDPWGTITPQDGGVNEVDPTTGVLTISWLCNGYGENGVSVYTPL